jgi:hypothetical protein
MLEGTGPTRSVGRRLFKAAVTHTFTGVDSRRFLSFLASSIFEAAASPLVSILPMLFDLGQGVIGEAIETAGAGQFGRLRKEALDDSCDLAFFYL